MKITQHALRFESDNMLYLSPVSENLAMNDIRGDRRLLDLASVATQHSTNDPEIPA